MFTSVQVLVSDAGQTRRLRELRAAAGAERFAVSCSAVFGEDYSKVLARRCEAAISAEDKRCMERINYQSDVSCCDRIASPDNGDETASPLLEPAVR